MPKLFLAPMEGVTDWVMRDLLTSMGAIDHCVTEFLRVTDTLFPDSVFYKNCPELLTKSKTRSGTPVFVQLLGGQADPLALNAVKAVQLGALGIDLNFGCPAKTVNRHDGGASLLKSTDRIYNIVKTVRQAVPANTPVTVKIRLGFDDPSECLDNAVAITEAGANWLTVHCRTKTDGYRPPVYWEWIAKIKEVTKINIVANGDIWTLSDFKNCQSTTGCTDFMIGRGAFRNPFLFQQIKNSSNENISAENTIEKCLQLIPGFYKSCVTFKSESFAVARSKQWLNQLGQVSAEAKSLFDELKIIENPINFETKLKRLSKE
jgi:tRNA-dihydrouridine synthase C